MGTVTISHQWILLEVRGLLPLEFILTRSKGWWLILWSFVNTHKIHFILSSEFCIALPWSLLHGKSNIIYSDCYREKTNFPCHFKAEILAHFLFSPVTKDLDLTINHWLLFWLNNLIWWEGHLLNAHSVPRNSSGNYGWYPRY